MTQPVLLVEDEPTLAKNVRAYLARYDYDVHIAATGTAALAALDSLERLAEPNPLAVVLDYHLPDMNGLEVLEQVRARYPLAKIVMMTGQGSERVAVDAMKAGASDYLTKPVELNTLRRAIAHAMTVPAPRTATNTGLSRAASNALDRLIGSSDPMLALKHTIQRVIDAESSLADVDAPAVLVTGETGTGKELVARALHFAGGRAGKPFVEVNCSGIPANLLESELFGHERGAFTGAQEQKIGLVEAAHGGTLFLDEIGEIELNAQAKLLRLLEDKLVRRVGSVRERKVDVRIVAATNRDLEALVRAGRFRADLYFRLKIIALHTPPLRTRGADVALLADHFLALQRERYGKPALRFAPAVTTALMEHAWPGNVRELRNVIEQSVVLASSDIINTNDLAMGRAGSMDISQPLAIAAMEPPSEAGAGASLNLAAVERDMLVRALESSGWNVSKAARVLGISRDTLRYRIDKFQLKLPS